MLFDDACPLDARKKIIQVQTAYAQAGNAMAARFVFERIYGTPQSGDDAKVREAVEAELDKFFTKLREALPSSIAEQVAAVVADMG